MIDYKDLEEIISGFGIPIQVDKALEEMIELSLELYQFKKGKGDITSIKEEIADVMIMVNQLMLIFSNENEINQIIAKKINRTKSIIEDTNNIK